MPDDLRAAAERVVAAALWKGLVGYPQGNPGYQAGVAVDAFLASSECLALAVRTACEPGWAIVLELSPGGEVFQVHRVVQRPRPDVAALLESTGEGAGDG